MTETPDPLAPIDAGPHGTGMHPLHRNLGVRAVTFMVIAAAAPLSVVVGSTPVIIAVSSSTAVPLFFVVVTVLLLVFSVGFTLMSRYVTNAGAFYSYIRAGLGRLPGGGAAFLALVSYFMLFVAVGAYAGVATANVLETFTGVPTPWWLWALAWVGIIGALGYRDIELSSKVLGVLLIVEAVAVVILDGAIIGHGGNAGLSLQAFDPSEFASGVPGLGVMFAFFAFFGFEATVVFRNEARDPIRTIPRATYLSVLLIGIFYAVSSWAVIIGIGTGEAVADATANPQAVVLNLAAIYVAPVFGQILQVLLVTSIVACLISFHNVLSRYVFTLGEARMLPRWFGVVHRTHRAPSRASLVVTGASALFIGVTASLQMDPVAQVYTWFSGAATLGIVALLALTSVAVITFFHSHATSFSRWKTTVAPTISLVGLSAVVWMVSRNFDLLVGGWGAAAVFIAVLAGTFAVGVCLAQLRGADPTHTTPTATAQRDSRVEKDIS